MAWHVLGRKAAKRLDSTAQGRAAHPWGSVGVDPRTAKRFHKAVATKRVVDLSQVAPSVLRWQAPRAGCWSNTRSDHIAQSVVRYRRVPPGWNVEPLRGSQAFANTKPRVRCATLGCGLEPLRGSLRFLFTLSAHRTRSNDAKQSSHPWNCDGMVAVCCTGDSRWWSDGQASKMGGTLLLSEFGS